MSGELFAAGTLTPAAGHNTFPIAEDRDIRNGCRVVADHASRNAIDPRLIDEGALVLVVDSDGASTFKAYRYLGTSPASDGNWVEFASPGTAAVTAVPSSPYTILASDQFIQVNTSAARTLNLPDPANNGTFIIKDVTGSAWTNNITLHRHGSEKIENAAADLPLGSPYGCWLVWSDGTDWWVGGPT
jgi:hypothetical protein